MANTLLADNGVSSGSAGLKSTADGTGVLALQTTTAGGAATTALSISTAQVVTLTNALPMASGGTGVTTAPAFSATPTTTQAVTSATYTKVNFGTENFDTNNNFASSRFTPTIAGYYFISGSIYSVSTAAATYIWALIYKNGALTFAGNLNVPVSTVDGVGTVNGLIYMNGSTDYLEMYCYLAGTSPVIQTGANTVFSGVLVRGA
jgi:hypothetical protein